MILSPVVIKTEDEKVVSGILVEKDDAFNLISLIDRVNADGLKGADALLLMQMKEALKDLSDSTIFCPKEEK